MKRVDNSPTWPPSQLQLDEPQWWQAGTTRPPTLAYSRSTFTDVGSIRVADSPRSPRHLSPPPQAVTPPPTSKRNASIGSDRGHHSIPVGVTGESLPENNTRTIAGGHTDDDDDDDFVFASGKIADEAVDSITERLRRCGIDFNAIKTAARLQLAAGDSGRVSGGRVGSGRVGSGRVGSGRVEVERVARGRGVSSHGSSSDDDEDRRTRRSTGNMIGSASPQPRNADSRSGQEGVTVGGDEFWTSFACGERRGTLKTTCAYCAWQNDAGQAWCGRCRCVVEKRDSVSDGGALDGDCKTAPASGTRHVTGSPLRHSDGYSGPSNYYGKSDESRSNRKHLDSQPPLPTVSTIGLGGEDVGECKFNDSMSMALHRDVEDFLNLKSEPLSISSDEETAWEPRSDRNIEREWKRYQAKDPKYKKKDTGNDFKDKMLNFRELKENIHCKEENDDDVRTRIDAEEDNNTIKSNKKDKCDTMKKYDTKEEEKKGKRKSEGMPAHRNIRELPTDFYSCVGQDGSECIASVDAESELEYANYCSRNSGSGSATLGNSHAEKCLRAYGSGTQRNGHLETSDYHTATTNDSATTKVNSGCSATQSITEDGRAVANRDTTGSKITECTVDGGSAIFGRSSEFSTTSGRPTRVDPSMHRGKTLNIKPGAVTPRIPSLTSKCKRPRSAGCTIKSALGEVKPDEVKKRLLPKNSKNSPNHSLDRQSLYG